MWQKNIEKIAQGESKNIGTALYSAKPVKKNDNLLTVQCIICAVVFAVIYVLGMFNSTFFEEIKAEFNAAIESGIKFSSETPLLRFIDDSVNDAREAAINLSEELSGMATGAAPATSEEASAPTTEAALTETAETTAPQAQSAPIAPFAPQEAEITNATAVPATTAETSEAQQESAPSTSDENSTTNAIGGFTNMSEEELSHIISLEPYTLDVQLIQPSYGYLSSSFGERENPITGKEEFHVGIDIAAAQGTKVVAAYSGQVVETGYTDQRGNYIILHHKEGMQTLYQHLQCGYVRTGQNVDIGQPIGTVGSTGLSTGPHLHFELILNRKRVDPLQQFPLLAETLNNNESEQKESSTETAQTAEENEQNSDTQTAETAQ